MSVTIYSKRLGINRCYVIKASGCIMVDTGPSISERAIENWFESIPVAPEEIRLLILTHGHADHVGAASHVKNITGAKIAMHKMDKDMLERGEVVWPSPVTTWGRLAIRTMVPLTSLFRFPGANVDLVIGDEGLSLSEYGIPGRIIHTPGHTLGSISVLLETGEALVGCMTHNAPPFRTSPNLPIFADDLPRLRNSWRSLIDQGAQTIFPAHGNSFPVEIIQEALEQTYPSDIFRGLSIQRTKKHMTTRSSGPGKRGELISIIHIPDR
jgi:glyoxylase-like metal-dependent hydrolase (beta-lactamase superfamily II)